MSSNKLVIEVHVGKRYGASRLNCDENGKMKSIMIDGKKHNRISSQAKKFAWRQHFNEELDEKESTYRTRAIVDILADKFEELEDDFYKEHSKELAVLVFEKIISSSDTKLKNNRTNQIIIFTNYDIDDIVNMFCDNVKSEDDLKKMKKNDWDCIKKEIEKKLPLRRQSVECSLFGRMSTSNVMNVVESSVCVNHSVSLGRSETEMDYFTAIDNYLSEISDDVGAGHINRKNFGSSVYYEYASIDVSHFYDNLCKGIDMSVPENKNRVKQVLIESVKMLLYEIAFIAPAGAQNSFASSSDPVGIYVTARDKYTNRTADTSMISVMTAYNHESESDMFITGMKDFTSGEFSLCNDYIKKMYVGYRPDAINAEHVNWSDLVNQIEVMIDERF